MLKCKICGCEFNALGKDIIFPATTGKLDWRLLLEAIRKIYYMTHLIVLPAVVR